MGGWKNVWKAIFTKSGIEAKTSPLPFKDIFVNFRDKELRTKFCGVLISFYEVVWIYKVLNSTYLSKCTKQFTLFFHIFLWRKNVLKSFAVFFSIFHKFMSLKKFWIIKLCLNISGVIPINKNNILIVA